MAINSTYSISVIIPYHVVNEQLYRAVDSILKQSRRPTDVILVNDACEQTIDTNRLDSGDISIKAKALNVNSGPATARNYGLKYAAGNFIAFLDSDDYWLPEKLENQVNALKRQVEVDKIVVISAVTVIASGKVLYRRYPIMGNADQQSEKVLKGPFMYLGSTALFSAKLGRKVGDQTRELRIYEGFEWQIRLAFGLSVRFLSTGSPDVYIERSKRTHTSEMLKKNHQALVSSVNKVMGLPKAASRYLAAIYSIDRAASEFYQRNFIKFIYFLVLSFATVPRTTLLLDRFWIKDKNSLSV